MTNAAGHPWITLSLAVLLASAAVLQAGGLRLSSAPGGGGTYRLVSGTTTAEGSSKELSRTSQTRQKLNLNKMLDENYGAIATPTPTEAEKKIGPAVKTAETGFFLFVWAKIILEKLGGKK
jgi:hypothetical protein